MDKTGTMGRKGRKGRENTKGRESRKGRMGRNGNMGRNGYMGRMGSMDRVSRACSQFAGTAGGFSYPAVNSNGDISGPEWIYGFLDFPHLLCLETGAGNATRNARNCFRC